MITPQPPLGAYRTDVSRLSATLEANGDQEQDARMVGWLVYAELLQRLVPLLAGVPGPELQREISELQPKMQDVIQGHRLSGVEGPADLNDPQAVSALTRQIADAAEQRGALHQGYSMLYALEALANRTGVLEQGRVLAQRARIARKTDDVEVARTLYLRVKHLGREALSAELLARAEVGLGALALIRGNYPAARRHYRSAVLEADRSGIHELSRIANHGAMIVAARRGEFADALLHGWRAFHDAAGDAELEGEMLLNLAQLALDLGDSAAALNGFTAALWRTSLERRVLPALGGAARAAAARGDEPLAQSFERRLRLRLQNTVLSYPQASASFDIALAHATMGNRELARRAAAEVVRMARAHAFHELEHQASQLLEQLAGEMARQPVGDVAPMTGEPQRERLSERAEAVLHELAALRPSTFLATHT